MTPSRPYRQNFRRRLQDALREIPAVSLEDLLPSWEGEESFPPLPPPPKVVRAPTHDFAADAERLEDETTALRAALVNAEARAEALRKDSASSREAREQAEQALLPLQSAVKELQARFAEAEGDREALRATLARAEEEAAALRERTASQQAALEAKERALGEERALLARVESELAAFRAAGVSEPAGEGDPLRALEARLAERTEQAREKSERVLALEQSLAETAARDREREKAREELRAALAKKETEFRLLNENLNRLARQNKELLARVQAFQEGRGSAEPRSSKTPPAPAATDPMARERMESLELSIREHDRMLVDQQKLLDEALAKNESLNRAAVESERSAREWAHRVEALQEEKAALEERLAGPAAAAPAGADERLARLEREKAEAEAKAVREADERRKAEDKVQEMLQQNEDLETRVRLLVMNSESIDRVEKNLRETFRLMSRTPITGLKPAGTAAEPPPAPAGFWARFTAWWSAPLLKLPFLKKDAAPAVAAPPAAPAGPSASRRVQNFRQRRLGR